MSAPPTLCFTQASQKLKNNELTEDEYDHSILAHCTGYLHDSDDDDASLSQPSPLQSTDVFAYAVQCFMKRKDFIKDITPLKEAFKALSSQDIPTIQQAATKLNDQPSAKKFLHKILALRSLQLRKAAVLRYCLDVGGFPYEAYFEEEADGVREEDDTETFKVLEESRFRKVCPRKGKEGEDEDVVGVDNLDDVERDRRGRERAAATFEKGGDFPVDW